MRKFRKIVGYFLLTVGILLAAFTVINWKHIQAFPSIISAYYAKEFCSCYFITGQSEEFCHDYTRQYVPISDFSLDKEKKSVTVSGLGRTTTASFHSAMTGCAYD
ncbi:MAG: hypothetical protein KDK41_07150 [Leptospiraceae bacterium]|nr:hypothetical protein [Leptospiraceae bacterium]MCB1200405.1 hypothetical protein [Leptospiraceae bacterium]